MKRASKLIFSEFRSLFRTITLMGIIMLFFIAALLSVISVLIDIPDGFYNGMNDYYGGFNKLSVDDIDLDTATAHGGTPIYGHVNGLTRYSVISSKKTISSTPSPMIVDEDEKTEQVISFTVTSYIITEYGLKWLPKYSDSVTKGRLPEKNGEIAINTDISRMLGANVGDQVTFEPDYDYVDPENETTFQITEPTTFEVVGIINTTKISSYKSKNPKETPLPSAHIYMVSDITTFDRLCMNFEDSRAAHSEYKNFIKLGKTCTLGSSANYEIIDTAVAFFGAVTAVLGIMVVFIIYALIAIFYRQRKGMICRLKLFGATDGQIGFIYCTIAVTLVFLSVAIGSVLAMAFNVYFIDLCGQLFDIISANFVSHFRPIVQISVFAALALFTILIFFIYDRKIKNTSISSEVRYE